MVEFCIIQTVINQQSKNLRLIQVYNKNSKGQHLLAFALDLNLKNVTWINIPRGKTCWICLCASYSSSSHVMKYPLMATKAVMSEIIDKSMANMMGLVE